MLAFLMLRVPITMGFDVYKAGHSACADWTRAFYAVSQIEAIVAFSESLAVTIVVDNIALAT